MPWPPSFVCRRIALVVFGVSLLLYLTLSGMLLGLGLDVRAVLVVAQLVALLGLSVWLARLLRLPLRDAFSLRPAAPVHWLMVFVAAVPLQALGGGLQYAVLRALPAESPIRQLMEQTLGGFVAVEGVGDLLMLFVAAVLTAAVCEEVLFRGLLLQLLRRRSGWRSAIVWSAVLFALYHLNPVVLLPVGLVGMYLALLVWRSGSLYPAIVAHAFNNGLALFGLPLVVDETAYDRYLGVTVAVSATAFGLLLWQYLRHTSPAVAGDNGTSSTPTARWPGRLEQGRIDGGLGDGEQTEQPEQPEQQRRHQRRL